MAYLYNGQPVNIRVEFFRTDGVRYNNLLDAAIRTKVGIVENGDPDPFEPAAPDYDQRFYWGQNNPKLLNDREEVDQDGNPLWEKVLGEVDGKPTMVDSNKRLVTKGLKSQWTAQVKDTAGKMLAATDWMVIRKVERSIDIPAATQAFRVAVIAEANRLETAIAACADVPALIDVVMNQNWPRENN
jgi:hypothetical protein